MGRFTRQMSTARRHIKAKTSDFGDAVSDKVTRVRHNVSGSLKGGWNYNRLKRFGRSFNARELVDSKKIKKNLKEIHKGAKHLSNYSEKDLQVIYERYGGEDELDKELRKLADKFRKDLTNFIQHYHEFLVAINDSLVKQEYFDAASNSIIIQSMQGILKHVEEGEISFREGVIGEVQKHLYRMMKEKEYDLKEEYVELTHLEDGKIHKGAYVLFSGITPIMHQFRKFYKSKERKEFRKMLENVKKIDQQLSNGVKPNALNIELQLFQDIEKLSRYELELYHDLHLMINISQEDYKKALSSAADFLEAFNSKEIAKLVSQLREEHEHVSEMLESEKKSDKRLDEQIRNVAGKSKKILDEIGNLSETWHEMAMENPEEFVENKAA